MQRIASTLFVVLSAGLLTPAWAQLTATPANPLLATPAQPRSKEADLIRGWYRDYLGREVGPELSAWVELLRGGMSPTDVQATILGSDEFYYQKGRDPETFVLETLQSVTWEEPTVGELRRWTDRLTALRGDRFALSREILLAHAQSQTPGNQASEIVTRLNSAAKLAVDTIDFEIGGTPQGRQANLQAQALASAVDQLRRTLSNRSWRPADVRASLDNAERSHQALQTTLSNPPGTAPSAAGIVRRIGTMLADVRYATSSGNGSAYPPYPGSPPGSGSSRDVLLEQVTAAKRAVESLIQMLTSQAYQSYSYSVVLRDLDTLAARLAGLELSARGNSSRERLSWELQSVLDIAARIEPQLLAGRPPYFARLYWQSVESSLDQLRESVGVSDGSTVLRPTPLHESLLPLLDQAIAQIDVFLTGTNPLVFGIPDVPRVQRDARALRGRVLTLRQQAGAGEPAEALKQTLTAMVSDYKTAFDRWNQIVAAHRLINPARISPVGETLNRVEQLINETLASGTIGSAGPNGASQLLTLLGSEVSETSRLLAWLSDYREQQSIQLYLEQISGYVQSIGDALSRQSTLDARRQAVAVQGVVGRMHSEVESLNQRVAAGGPRELRQLASDVHLRAARIAKLVDDIEAALY
jgi:hypothetical protein